MAMLNAAKELLEEVQKTGSSIKCATIYVYDTTYNLPENYSDTMAVAFVEKLNLVAYDNGYGGQELYGTVWLSDGTWLSRGEYDGSEWWEHHKVPEIPEQLLQIKLEIKS